MANEDCPCNGCVPPKRHSGCHPVCPDYLKWEAKHKAKLAKLREAQHHEYATSPRKVWKSDERRRKKNGNN